jgi:hypothetical protein
MSERFSERWAQRERECGFDEIASGMVAFGADTLPLSAAPCLDFHAAQTPKPVFEVFGAISDWSEEDQSRLKRFVVIGSDGAGNPICLDKPTGKVILLDHEDKFRSVQFVALPLIEWVA